jgi:hypothetical protein
MFIATLFTIAKLWNEPRYSSTNKKKLYIYIYIYIYTHTHTHTHTHTIQYYLAIRNEILSFAVK